MIDKEYMEIRSVMEQRGTRGGENKRLPVTIVNNVAVKHLEEVEIRLRKVQMAAPVAIGLIGLMIGLMCK